MRPVLEKQYDDILEFLLGLHSYHYYLRRKLFPKIFKYKPQKGESKFQSSKYNLGLKSLPDSWIEFVTKYTRKNDIKEPFFSLIINKYPMEAVSLELEKRFKGYDFENILNLLANREVNTHLAEPTFGKAVGFVVAIASFMLKMVPSSIIKDDLQLDYTLYQKNVFYVLSTSLFYIIILLGGTLIRNYKAKIRKAYFANILSYVKYKNQSQINAANNEQ